MRNVIVIYLIIALVSGCSSQSVVSKPSHTDIPTESLVPSATPVPTSTETVVVNESMSVTETLRPTATETSTPEIRIDLSSVTLHGATFLMDPRYFQVSLDNWPDDAPEDLVVSIDTEPYSCSVLFPDDFPDRIYCFGPAPRKGDQVAVVVTQPEADEPLLEIPFVVPAPGGGGDG